MKALVENVKFVNYQESTKPGSLEFHEGIPVNQLNQVYDTIGLYRSIVAITIIANSIVVLIGFIYL